MTFTFLVALTSFLGGLFIGGAAVHFRSQNGRTGDMTPAISLYVSIFLLPVLACLSYWLFQKPGFKEFSVITAVLAALSPVLGVAFNQLKSDLSSLRRTTESITPKFLQAYFKAISADAATTDHSLPAVAKHLYERAQEAFIKLAESELVQNQVFFARMRRELERMKEGDRLLAICGRKFWTEESEKIISEYWNCNREVAVRKVQVRRVFVSDATKQDDPPFSRELAEAREAQLRIRKELKSWRVGDNVLDLSDNFRIRQVERGARDDLNIDELLVSPMFGFALISRRDYKAVSLHRLDGDRLKGTLIEDPLVYSVFEEHFWQIWEVGEEPDF